MTSKKTMEITNGPSKWDIMLALFDSTYREPRYLTFEYLESGLVPQLRKERKATMVLESVEKEDGSGESWNLVGLSGPSSRYFIFYNTKTRKGHIILNF